MLRVFSFVFLLLCVLPTRSNAVQIINGVSQEKVLVIGCGHIEPEAKAVECNCMRQAVKMGRHVHQGHYTVSLSSISNPDLIGNIRDPEVLANLVNHKFDVIWLEHTPIELSEDTVLLSGLFQMLAAGGVLVAPLDHKTNLEAVSNCCSAISCSDFVIDESGVVVRDSGTLWWVDVLSLMSEHGPVVKDRLRQALYWKER